MSESKRSKITPEHIEEARRLKDLYDARPSPRLSQAEFGDRFDIGTQGAVWQYLNARTPLNRRAAIGFANGLGCHVSDFSERLAAEISRGQGLAHPTSNLKSATRETETQSPPLSMAHAGIFPVDDLPLITEEDIMGKAPLPERFLFRCSTELPSLEGGLAASDGDILLINCKVRAELGDIALVQMKDLAVARVLYAASGGIGYFVDGHIIEARDAKLIGVAEEVRKLRRSR